MGTHRMCRNSFRSMGTIICSLYSIYRTIPVNRSDSHLLGIIKDLKGSPRSSKRVSTERNNGKGSNKLKSSHNNN